MRQTAPLCNHLRADFDENVSGLWPIDKDVTPSYVSSKPPADRLQAAAIRMKDARKARLFPLSATMNESTGRAAVKLVPANRLLPLGFGRVQRHLTEREGLTA